MQTPRKWTRPSLATTAIAGDAFAAHVRAALEQIAANSRGAAEGRDPEYLHQLRVGVRRLRSILRVFRELLRRRRAEAVQKPWRAAMRTLGRARDWDVFRSTIGSDVLRALTDSSRADAQRRVQAVVRSALFREAQRQAGAWAQGRPWRWHANPGERLSHFGARALQRLFVRLHESAGGMDWTDAPRRHMVRIRVKQMRYGCDLFETAFSRPRARAFAATLHVLQGVLGELNDIEVQHRLLRRMAPVARTPKYAEALAAHRLVLAAREREFSAALGPAWSAFAACGPYWQGREAARAKG